MERRERISPTFLSAYGLFPRRNAMVSEVLVSALWVAGAIFPRGSSSWSSSWPRRTYLEHLNLRSGWL